MLRFINQKMNRIIWSIGILTAIASFLTIGFYESRRLHDQLDRQFNNKIKALNASFEDLSELMYSTRAFLLHANNPSQEQFQYFLDQKTGIDSAIQSVIWAPSVTSQNIESLEQEAAQQGLLGYAVLTREANDPAFIDCVENTDNTFFPALYVSPKFEGSDYLGSPVAGNCEQLQAMHRAAKNNQIVAAPFIQDGFIGSRLFLPVILESQELTGFVVSHIFFYEFLGKAWKDEVNAQSFNINVFQADDSSSVPIFESHINSRFKKVTGLEQEVSRSKELYISALDTTWKIQVSQLDNSHSTFLYGGFCVFLIALLTYSVAWGARFYSNRLAISNKLVEDKTRSIEQQAIRDDLTNLYNRQALNLHLTHKVASLKTHPENGFAVLFIDLDRFKVINDSMGHLVGDNVLQQVALRLTESTRLGDKCYRFGGDEFVVCLYNNVDPESLGMIAKRYNELLAQPYNIQGRTCHVGASIGISMVNEPCHSVAQILREADTAMYKAKRSANDRIVFFDDTMFIQAKQRFTLEQELTQAVALQQLFLAYQPIYCQKTHAITGVEALLRWTHKDYGPISPADFIPIAEETGLIIKIGDWVVKRACRTLEQLWLNPLVKHVPRININVSAKQFESNHILHTLQAVLEHASFPPQLLGVEITESLLLSNSECTVRALKQIKELGISIYLDDFGSGYSSLAVLCDYPIDILKMDKSFIDNIDSPDCKSAKLCKAIINMAHTISLPVVAEGVETKSQLATLADYQCDYIQGYLKSKPVSVCVLTDLLETHNFKQSIETHKVIKPAEPVEPNNTLESNKTMESNTLKTDTFKANSLEVEVEDNKAKKIA